MGLDVVELVMEIEETFGITIPDEEAEKLRTVGDVYAFILGRLEVARDLRARSVCPTAAAFYALRRGLVGALGEERSAIRPATATAELLGRRGRRRAWRRLQAGLNLRLPNLEPSRLLVNLFTLVALAAAPTTGYGLWRLGVQNPGVILGLSLLGLLMLPVAVILASRPLWTGLPAGCATVGGLTEATVRLNFGSLFLKTGTPPTAAEVWEALRSIFAETLGVDPAVVTPEKRIVEDLGAG